MDDDAVRHVHVFRGVQHLGERVAIGDAELEDREAAGVVGAELAQHVVDVVHPVEASRRLPKHLTWTGYAVQIDGCLEALPRQTPPDRGQGLEERASLVMHGSSRLVRALLLPGRAAVASGDFAMLTRLSGAMLGKGNRRTSRRTGCIVAQPA
jgi:hypothetical protein